MKEHNYEDFKKIIGRSILKTNFRHNFVETSNKQLGMTPVRLFGQ